MALDERLMRRYGQQRWNPAAGQHMMTFTEWLDRHPAIKNIERAKQGYAQAVSAEGIGAWQARTGGVGKDTAPEFRSRLGTLHSRGKVVGPGTIEYGAPADPGQLLQRHPAPSVENDDAPRVAVPGGPDKPPRHMTNPVGGTYKDFVKSHGGKSRAGLAAIWRTANNMPMSKKMAESAAGRRLTKKQHEK